MKIISEEVDTKEFLKQTIEVFDINEVCEAIVGCLAETEITLADNPESYNLMKTIYNKIHSEEGSLGGIFLERVVGLDQVIMDFVHTFCICEYDDSLGIHFDILTGIEAILKLTMLEYFDMNDEEKEGFIRKVKFMATGENYNGDIIK